MLKKNIKQLTFFIFFLIFLKIYSYSVNDLINVTLYKTCPKCDLKNAPLRGYNLKYSNLEGSDLSGADLSGARLQYSNMRNTKNVKTVYNAALLDFVDASDSNFNGAFLKNIRGRNAIFNNCLFDQADFIFSTVTGALFLNAKFNNTIFNRADLTKANLSNATGTYTQDDMTTFCYTVMPNKSTKIDRTNYRCTGG